MPSLPEMVAHVGDQLPSTRGRAILISFKEGFGRWGERGSYQKMTRRKSHNILLTRAK